MSRLFLPISVVVALLVGGYASAQPAQTTRVRGTIENLEGNVLSVKARDGASV